MQLNYSFRNSLKCTATLMFLLLLINVVGCSTSQNTEPTAAKTTDKNSDGLEHLLNLNARQLEAIAKTDGTETALTDTDELIINFAPEPHIAAIDFVPDQPWNWESEDEFHIAFDAKNTGENSIHFYLGITDTDGSFANRGTSIAAGESTTLYAILKGKYLNVDGGFKEQSIPPWQQDKMLVFRWGNGEVDLSKVAKFTLFVRGAVKNKTLTVNNFRLHRNLPYGTDHLERFADEFGQNAKQDYPLKIHSLEELQDAAKQELEALAKSSPMPDRSRFGGWKDGPKLEATGYYRTEKVNGKWWMVDPDGYLFFSHGVANVRMANLTTITGVDFTDSSVREIDADEVTPEDSIGIVQVSDEVRATRHIASPLRNKMFNWLPEYDDPMAKHYSYRRSVLHGPVTSGETFSFYRANLERRYGETEPLSFIRKWEEVTLARMLDWGFTSMGNWVDPAFYPNTQVPYFANGWIIGDFKTLASKFDVWAPTPDPYDPEFARRAEITIKVIAEEIQSSPWCVGIFIDNEKSWGFSEGSVEQRYGLILDALSKRASDSPAKTAFIAHLKEKYASINELNSSWSSEFSNWAALDAGFTLPEYSTGFEADMSKMLWMLSDQYFTVVHNTLEKMLPNHLYMGARMANWGMPKETIEAAIKYSDVLSFNIYNEGIEPKQWAFLDDIDLPTVIGEYHIGATSDTGLFHPGLVHAASQKDRAKMYTDYMGSVLAQDTMVGAHWFQYVDSPISGRAFDGENYNVGFVSVTDIPYPEMVAATKAFNEALYPRRYND